MKSQFITSCLVLGIAALTPFAIAAQDTADTVTVPDLHFEAKDGDIEEYHKYHYFHGEGVSYDKAFADISECRVYQDGPAGYGDDFIIQMPGFVSLSESQTNITPVVNNQAGLVGVVIGELVSGPLVLKNRAQRMRKCMEFKGYDRYGLSKELWKQINNVDVPTYIALHAKIVSGPKPKAEKILP